MKVFLVLLSIIVLCHGFNKEEFLKKHCKKADSYFAEFRFHIKQICLICKDVNLNESDAQAFKNEEFHLTNMENVIFEGGNVGVVNSEFFKHFPHTKVILFSNVSINLAPSDLVNVNSKIETVGIIGSTISRNQRTNAFHSLSNLKIFVITGCFLEHTTIDGELLKMNKELVDITLNDSGVHPPEDHHSLLRHIDEDVFDNLDKVEKLYLGIEAMTKAYAKWFQEKPLLNDILLYGRFEEFPKGIPDSVEELDVHFTKVKHIKRDDLKNLKNLTRLAICEGDLESVAEDTLDDLVKLKTLFLSANELKHFSSRHLKHLERLSLLGIEQNPLDDLNFLEESHFVQSTKRAPGIYVKKDDLMNNVE
ncbi:Tl.2 family protein [Megaselia abdita]